MVQGLKAGLVWLFTGAWFKRHRTLIFAAALTVAIGAAVLSGHFQPARAVFPISVVWALAFHSIDNHGLVRRYEGAVERALVVLAAAGITARAGKPGEAACDVAKAVEEAVSEIHAANAEVQA